MLRQHDTLGLNLINKTDSFSILSVKNKIVQAYDSLNKRIYNYTDNEADTLQIGNDALGKSRAGNIILFKSGAREAVIYYDEKDRITVLVAAYDEQGKKDLQHLTYILWLILIAGILTAFASGYFFSKILLRPVKKIADEVNSITAHNLAHRLKSGNANDEWNYLSETLNDLLNRLQESFEIQRRFISVASHELSTPLTSISSQLEVSLQRERLTEEYRKVIGSVYQDVRHLSKLTQTLLEFATVSGNAGGLELNLIRIDEVLMRLPSEMTKMDKSYTVKLAFDHLPEDEAGLLVFGNAELLFTAIKNIVSNACKYSPDRLAKIKLSVTQLIIAISVEDEGKGIPENELQNIFQPFYRAEDSRSTIGFGVGLPLVNRIIKLHKGQIKISSIVGKGTTFYIQLPVAGNT
ncbi:MAG: histidine kinase [Ferruginibacter sp.]|uniref:HAMP domain-containing sensor histidine kinase n=1 Tax=Ferruginibacter sp. TaxID=1940288 RepID=UPI002657E6E8|nr:HAMP domain-containing sensor histidine kinase [Ferruginibacter sp.]MDB5276568.1 histidine kinase [Ferruginibacter sp.]